MSFLGLFTFNAPYLPWVILGFGLMLGQSPVFDLLGALLGVCSFAPADRRRPGIAVGHIYFYLEDVVPQISNGAYRPLRTPAILCARRRGPFFSIADRLRRKQLLDGPAPQ